MDFLPEHVFVLYQVVDPRKVFIFNIQRPHLDGRLLKKCRCMFRTSSPWPRSNRFVKRHTRKQENKSGANTVIDACTTIVSRLSTQRVESGICMMIEISGASRTMNSFML